jgi:ankyrin repeat protein
MENPAWEATLDEFTNGRTDLVFDLIAQSCPPDYKDPNGISLLQHCAYYGDVSAIKFLLAQEASLTSLGDNLDLVTAAFHGHWRLCKFILEQGADVNYPDPQNGETPLHAALCKTDCIVYDRVLEVLLAHGADPNHPTKPGIETQGFMRDIRTRGETPLHRAAAFGECETIDMLLKAGARLDVRDVNGDSPLTWASWHLRPTPILRQLLFDNFRIRPTNQPMSANLLGKPQV